jgi:hypothetical protein
MMFLKETRFVFKLPMDAFKIEPGGLLVEEELP